MNFDLIVKWLSGEPGLTLAQIGRLQDVLGELAERTATREQTLRDAHEKMVSIAKEAGFTDLDAFMRTMHPGKSVVAAAKPELGPHSGHRRPYMDPLNPDQLYALPKRYPPPECLAKRMAEGWTREQLHYRNIAAAARDKGIKLDYDPVAKFQELSTAVPVRRR